jgi:peptide/nickel transport system substrate-binding protein
VDALVSGRTSEIGTKRTQAAFTGDTLKVNAGRPPMNDPRVRQALARAINPQQVKQAIFPLWEVTNSAQVLLPGWDWALPADEVKKFTAYDPAQAKQLLQAAGVTSWSPELIVNTSAPTSPILGQVIQANLQAIGITAKIREMDTTAYTDIVQRRKEYDLQAGTQTNGASPTGDLVVRFKSDGTLNMVQTSDPDLDRLITQQQGERDQAARKRLWLDIQRKILGLYGFIPVGTVGVAVLQWNFLKNHWPPIGSQFVDNEYTEVWIQKA